MTLNRAATGNGTCQTASRPNVVDRAIEISDSGKVQSVKALKKQLASEGFSMADLEGPYLARQLLSKVRH